MRPFKRGSRSLRKYLPYSLPSLVTDVAGPQRRFVFRGESCEDTDARGGSIQIDIQLVFGNRAEAVEWAKSILEQATNYFDGRGKKPEC